jgi:hypothetical protein
MGGESSTQRGEESCIQGLGRETEEKNLEEPGVDGRIILRWIFRNSTVSE